MYLLSDGHNYIGLTNDSTQTTVKNIKQAMSFSDEKKAMNYRDNLKSTLKKFNWQIVKTEETVKDETVKDEEVIDGEVIDGDIYDYIETELEKSGFDISNFFTNTIKTVCQLRNYANNMGFLEQQYNKKILDVRHYKRDINTKLNAIQLQRLEQFEIQLERERYECKSNRMIAEIFLADLKRLENINYVEVVRNVKESGYKPEIYTYEMLDEIVGKRKDK